MARVEWTRLAPEDVEAAIAMMLCREHSRANQVRPSRGDRGIDVYAPTDDGWLVYQVKSFTGRLTTSQKRQITESWNAFRTHVTERKQPVLEWQLVRPENPTWEDEDWLTGLTAGAPHPCIWKGLAFVDGLAAKYPEVIDYYLRDGKERLDATIRDYLVLVGVSKEEPQSIEATLASDVLTRLHSALNSSDPHYWYDYSVDRVREDKFPPITAGPMLVAALTKRDQHTAITFKIHAHSVESTTERPVPGSFTIAVERGTPDEIALRDFVEYGIPVDKLPVKDMNVDLPGGLGAADQAGFVSIGPSERGGAAPVDLRLQILSPDQTELAAVDLVMEPATVGLSGEKFAIRGKERFGVLERSLRFDSIDHRMNMNVSSSPVTGIDPADALEGLRVLAAFRPPNVALLSIRNGPALGKPIPIPTALDGADNLDQLIEIVEALATIRRQTMLPLPIPDLTEATWDDIEPWLRAARLLRGDSLTFGWDEMIATRDPNLSPPDPGQALALKEVKNISVLVGAAEVELGTAEYLLGAALPDPEFVDADPLRVRFIPFAEGVGTVRLLQAAELAGAAPSASEGS